MFDQPAAKSNSNYKLFLFSFLTIMLAYGFALTNFTITVDNEMPVLSDFGMELGRWGQNLIRYHLFNGYMPYFSLVLSLFLFALSAVRLANLFELKGLSSYMFCGLFLTFPQLAYQIVFSIMADVAAFGVLLSVVFIELFIKGLQQTSVLKKSLFFSVIALLLIFMLSIYQAFILIPISIYVLLFFKATYNDNFNLKLEMKRMLALAAVSAAGILLYVVSVKIICPPIQDNGYLASFVSGNSDNMLMNFLNIWYENLMGRWYYGEKLFVLSALMSLVLFVMACKERMLIILRFFTLVAILLLPFVMSAFITNDYHPPRLYLTSNLVFAFLIVFTFGRFNVVSLGATRVFVMVVLAINIYFITNLFYSANTIYINDKRTAERIDNIIQNKFPEFYSGDRTVYFYGYFPYEYHQKFRLDKSEIFGGSFYNWDNGSNYRIINFIKLAGVADYRMVNTQEELNKVKDSIGNMPQWPNPDAVKMINGIVVVKLSNEKGGRMYFEQP